MENKKSATRGFAVLTAAGILNKILSVAYVPILIQIIGDLGYGIYTAGYRIYAFIYILTNSGFPIAISKLQAELVAHGNYRDARRSFRIISGVMAAYGFTMAMLTAVFARQITAVMHYERAYLVILALAPTMLFSAISGTYRGFFNGTSNMKHTAMSQIIEQILNVILSLTFALMLIKYDVEWACAGATVGTTVGALGSALYLRWKYVENRNILKKHTDNSIKWIDSKTLIFRFLSYAIPIAFNSIVVFGGDLIDLWNVKSRLMSAGFSSDSAYVMFGALTKYSSLLNVPLAITTALYVAMMPSFSAAVSLNDNRQLKDHISDAFRISLMISIPAAVGLAVLSKPIFTFLFSVRYVDGWHLMAAGSVVVILYSIIQIQAGILQSINMTKYSTVSLLAGIGAKIFLNYFLIAIPSVNVMGAVIGTIVCYIIAMKLNSRYIKKYLPVKVVIKKHIGRPVVSSAAMALTAAIVYKLLFMVLHFFMPGSYMANAISTLTSVAAGAAVYGIVMLKIGGITKDDLEVIPYLEKLKKILPPAILSMARPSK